MKDKLLDFGAISAFAASSAATYCENVLDLGDGINPNYFGSGLTAKVVFTATAPTTGFTPCLYTGTTATPTTLCAQGATVASLPLVTQWRFQYPSRYPDTSGQVAQLPLLQVL